MIRTIDGINRDKVGKEAQDCREDTQQGQEVVVVRIHDAKPLLKQLGEARRCLHQDISNKLFSLVLDAL